MTATVATPENSLFAQKRPVTVLLVEDSPLIRDSLIDLIESDARCEVSMTTDTESDAIAALAKDEYCIVIIDLQLREGVGQGVLRFLQSVAKPPLRIVLTNQTEPRVRAQCVALGADHFFDKSREFEEVSLAIDRHLVSMGR